MVIKRMATVLIASIAGPLIAASAFAAKPDLFRYETDFNFRVVDCGAFEVWTSGLERDSEKWWYDEAGNPIKLQISIKVTESQYYNNMEPSKFVTQGKNGVGENVTITVDMTTGEEHASGAQFRLTIPGIGHVLLEVGTWFWDPSTQTLIHHGPKHALAEGETGLALCEALE